MQPLKSFDKFVDSWKHKTRITTKNIFLENLFCPGAKIKTVKMYAVHNNGVNAAQGRA